MKLSCRHICIAFFVCTMSASSWAHKASDAYLYFKQGSAESITAELSVALRDWDRIMETLDANNDRELSWGEIKTATPHMQTLAGQAVALRCGSQEISLPWRYQALEQRSDGVFVRLQASAPCDAAQALAVRYTLLQEVDADHRAVLAVERLGKLGSLALKPQQAWIPAQGHSANAMATLGSFIVLGMEHIGSGADHIAFIICLVLGLALVQRREWTVLLVTVTAFTLGHSVTLISATLGWVGSPRWVEPMIALSIAFAALVNLLAPNAPAMGSLRLKAAMAALFGLIHGLGFSGAMTEARLPEGSLLWALAGFNIGVELGQLVIIALWSLVYWTLYRWSGYKRWVVRGGSLLLLVMALYWFCERLGV